MTRDAINTALATLKKKWLSVAPKENAPHTPEVTKALDALAVTIKEVKAAKPS